MDNSGIEGVESEQCVCQACEANMKECVRKRIMAIFSGLDGKFREICAMFHLAQPLQTFASILLVGHIYVVELKLQALIVIQ